MIASFMMYAVIAAALLTLAAIAIEPVFIARGWPRRGIWIIAMLASVGLPALMSGLPSPPSLERLSAMAHITEPQQANRPGPAASTFLSGRVTRSLDPASPLAWPIFPSIDTELKYAWLALTIGLLILYSAGWIQMRRSLRKWPTEKLLDRTVAVSDDVGPAVLGFIKPRVIVPRWLISASEAMRSSVMAHESEHIAARDPLCLLSALALIAMMPWNPLLWWQLTRLRFAIEIDCDARVIRGEVDVLAYSETLLAVGQRGVRTLAGAMTLTETASQLERRIEIMTTQTRRYSVLILGAAVGISAACFAVAAELQAPNPFVPVQLAETTSAQRSAIFHERLNMRLKEADVRDIIAWLAGSDAKNVYLSSKVGGKITIEFKDTPSNEALDQILRWRRLVKRQDGDTIYIDLASEAPTAVQKVDFTGERLNLHFGNISIRKILQTLGDVSHQNMLVAKDVEFTTSVDLKDTPSDEALDIILKTNDLTSRRAGNLIIIENASTTVR